MICGDNCTTVTLASAAMMLVAVRLSVTMMAPLLVWVGSDMPTAMLLELSSVMTEALLFTEIKSAGWVPLVQKFAATTPSDIFFTAWTSGVLVRMMMSGLSA